MRAIPAFFIFSFLVVFLSTDLSAQRRQGGSSPLDTIGEEPSQKTGWEILQKFRSLWQPTGYRYHFRLKINPRNEKSRSVKGLMIGGTNERGVLMRVDVNLKEETANEEGKLEPALVQRYLLQNGLNSHAMDQRSDREVNLEIMDTEELLAPIANSTFSTFDLLVPYIYWQRFSYEGRMKLLSRPVHVYTMYPPDSDPALKEKISSVKIFIDDQFNGLVKAETYGTDGTHLKTFSLSRFRKVDGYWIFGEASVRNEATKDKTYFRVTDAKLGLKWGEDLFSPQSLLSNLSAQAIYPESAAFIETLSAE